jgi:hydrogenase nickel incorporation protein HypB
MAKDEKEFSRVMELESRKLSTNEKREEVIKTQKEVGKQNDLIALNIQEKLEENNIKSFDFVGAIGSGKTAILERLCERLGPKKRVLVICGDITTRVDADRIEKSMVKTIQINTGRECALNAYHIDKIIKNLELTEYDIIFIENVGNLICPSDFILGMEKRIVVVSITEGEWVVEKHPMLFKMSEIAIINKIDIQERLNTDIDKMVSDAKNINPDINVVLTSAKTGEGIDKLMEYMGLEKE